MDMMVRLFQRSPGFRRGQLGALEFVGFGIVGFQSFFAITTAGFYSVVCEILRRDVGCATTITLTKPDD